MKNILKILTIMIFALAFTYGQAEITNTLNVAFSTGYNNDIFFGIDQTASDDIDVSLGESDLPPLPPAGAADIRFKLPGGTLSSFSDFRNASSYPFSGTITYSVGLQYPSGATSVTFSYDLPAGITAVITDGIANGLLFSENISGTGSVTSTNTAISSFNMAVTYTNVSPSIPVAFATSPSSVSFGNVAQSTSATRQITVSNSGNSTDLEISNITFPSDYSVSPSTAVVAPGANQVFTVTLNSATLGDASGDITFTSNAPSSPNSVPVTATIVDAAPIFSASPSNIDFGTVSQGSSVQRTITVSNEGVGDPLVISGVTVPADFSILPAAATISAGSSQAFTLTFAPTSGGTVSDNVTFNYFGGSSDVAVSATIQSQGGSLMFASSTRSRIDASTYTDSLQLDYVGSPLKAIQFQMVTNGIINFREIRKGADINTPDWSFNYEIKRGDIVDPDSSEAYSNDTIKVVIYGLGLSTELAAGSYTNLVEFDYDVVDIVDPDIQVTSITLRNTAGSLYDGTNALIDEVSPQVITVNNRSMWGDVNNDNSVDVVDLLLVVDHILERIDLHEMGNPAGTYFTRADIAPWPAGDDSPSPDGIVNVQDLALIQNIILTNSYPSGITLSKQNALFVANGSLGKNSAKKEAVVRFYVTDDGIAVKLENEVSIRGIQLELSGINNASRIVTVDSKLGGSYFSVDNDYLRMLAYDRSGDAVINPGTSIVMNMPFSVDEKEMIKVEKVILAKEGYEKVEDMDVEIIYSNAPELPVDYSLAQNFPNPFNPSTKIRFSVPQTSEVSIKIFNMIGEEVATLYYGQVNRGTMEVVWNGKNSSGYSMPSGAYVYRMKAGNFVQSKKMMLIK